MTDKWIQVGEPMSVSDVVRVARDGHPATLASSAREKMRESRQYVEQLVDSGKTVYGISTGFGKLASVKIAPEDVKQLQRNLVVSHAMGVGEPFPTEVVRAMLLLRAQSLAQGYSGIRIEVVELIIQMLDR
jgi:histidine ammonia-lyase